MLIGDACHSGGLKGRRGVGGVTLAPAASGAGEGKAAQGVAVTIGSAGANELSAEDEQLGHGVFTIGLLNGLLGGADGDGRVTAHELARYLRQKIPQLASAAKGNETPVIDAPASSSRIVLAR